ncbi:MAG: hypothetical protein IJ560_02725 [Alphaproteobacteria bacterium]|nr:hypothetical protein [Alphaproteobacteria bacterium]
MIVMPLYARTLFVGDAQIQISNVQRTEHALHIMIGDVVYHADALPVDIPNTLHVLYGGVVYSICGENCDEYLPDYSDRYTVSDDCKLIGVDENAYISANGYQEIDTGIVGANTIKTSLDVHVPQTISSNYTYYIYKDSSTQKYDLWEYNKNGTERTIAFNYGTQNIKYFTSNTRYVTPNRRIIHIESGAVRQNSSSTNVLYKNASDTFSGAGNLKIFRNIGTVADTIKLYGVKMYKSGTLIRNFVPIPMGMEICGWRAPSNGLFDIVEQKFYENVGVGSLGYGVDVDI